VAVTGGGVTGEQRKLYYGELHDLHASANALNVITSMKMMWAGPAKRMGEEEEYRQLFNFEN
jgi:hypothetical protein